MKKTIGAIALSLLTALSAAFCFSGCGDGATEIIVKVPRSQTMNSVARPDIKNVKTLLEYAGEEFTQQYKKEVKINVIEFEEGGETKAVYNTFGTQYAADILYDGFFNMSSFIHTGNAVPLDDILSEDIKSDLNEKYVEDGRYDGKLYMLPYTASQNILIYNKDMLRDCGLDGYIEDGEIISSWSLEEWTYILDTLAEKLPDGKVPIMMYAKDSQGDTHMMSLIRSHGSDLFDENDNFVFDEKAVEALRWIQSGVEKGWYLPLPQDKTMNDYASKFKLDELCFYNFNLGSSNYDRVKQDGGMDKYGFVNYPESICTSFAEGFEVFDNGDSEKITVAKDFLKFFYASEKWMDCSAGSLPVSGRVMEKYKSEILLLEAFSDNAVNAVDFTRNLPNWQGSGNSVRSVFYQEMSKLFVQGAGGKFTYTPEQCAQSMQEKLNAAITSGRENSKPHN